MVTILIIMLIITNEQNKKKQEKQKHKQENQQKQICRAAHFTYSTLSLVKPRNVLSLSSSSKLF